MNFGFPVRVVNESATPTTHIISPGACKLIGILCTTVGQTDLPVDPSTALPPTITSVEPVTGPDGTEVLITGANFGEQGERSQVQIGPEDAVVPCVILSWAPDAVVVQAVLGSLVTLVPQPLWLRTNDKQDVQAGTFTFAEADEGTPVQTRESGKRHGKKGHHKQVHIDDVDTPRKDTRAIPTFPSGAGIMLMNAVEHIMVGPMEMVAGTLYPLSLDCQNGLELVSVGPLDITLLLQR